MPTSTLYTHYLQHANTLSETELCIQNHININININIPVLSILSVFFIGDFTYLQRRVVKAKPACYDAYCTKRYK